MPDWSQIDRSHVLAAIGEADRLGAREFLSRYRFARAKAATLWHGGQEYDSNAIVGFAYLHATGHAVGRSELAGNESATARVLQGLGFDVVVDEDAIAEQDRVRAARELEAETAAESSTRRTTEPRKTTRKPAAKKPAAKPKPEDRPVKICPTCYTALPATGICDFCD